MTKSKTVFVSIIRNKTPYMDKPKYSGFIYESICGKTKDNIRIGKLMYDTLTEKLNFASESTIKKHISGYCKQKHYSIRWF